MQIVRFQEGVEVNINLGERRMLTLGAGSS